MNTKTRLLLTSKDSTRWSFRDLTPTLEFYEVITGWSIKKVFSKTIFVIIELFTKQVVLIYQLRLEWQNERINIF